VLAWGLLGNAVRAGCFFVVLLAVVKLDVLNVRGFFLMTMFGYFCFLAVEIYGLQMHASGPANEASNGAIND
jgi:hypothetical protein